MQFSEHAIAFFSFLIIAAITSLIAKSFGFYHLPAQNKVLPWSSPVSLTQVLGGFIILMTVEIMAVPLFYYLWIFLKEGKLPDFSFQKPNLLQLGWLNILAILATAFALGIYSFLLGKQTTRQIWGQGASHRKYGFLLNFLVGALTWLVAYPLVTAFGQLIAMMLSLFYQGPHSDQVAVKHLKSIMDSPWLFPITVIEIVTIVPAIEEFIFRGLLQTWLKGKLGVISAILTTSVIFALFHFSFGQGIDNIELVLSLFILSCFLGFLRERQQSLWASIGLHSTFNAISIVFLSKMAIIFLL